jgi:hypothetical protein
MRAIDLHGWHVYCVHAEIINEKSILIYGKVGKGRIVQLFTGFHPLRIAVACVTSSVNNMNLFMC